MSSPGQIAGGLVGAVAGFFLSGMNPMGAAYGAQAGMMLGGALDPPKGPTLDGPGLDDLTVQTSTYGAPIPRVYGTIAVNGNVFWLENNILKETITKKKSGGKGGGSTTTTRERTYSAAFAVALSKGPIAGVRRIWIRGLPYYDAGSDDPGTIQASNAAAAGFHVYTGTDTQLPDARMQATLGVANTPAWRGLAYIVFYDLQLAKYSNSLMGAQIRVEVMTSAAPAGYVQTRGTAPSTMRNWRKQAWNGTVWCSVAFNSTYCMTSSDGLSWTEYSTLPYSECQGVAAIGTTFIAARSGGWDSAYRSTDGHTWTTVDMGTSGGYWQCPSTGNGIVLITSTGQNKLVRSANSGVTWTQHTFPHSAGNVSSPLWVPAYGLWFVFYTSTVTYCSTSADGQTWTSVSTGYTDSGFRYIDFIGTRIVAVPTVSANGILVSTDGINWTKYSTAFNHDGLSNDGINFLASTQNSIRYSPDGITWTSQAVSGLTIGCAGPVFNGSYFSCVTDGQSSPFSFIVTASALAPLAVALSSVVSAECLQSSILTSGDIDVIGLPGQVRGYLVGSIGPIRAALEPLQASWPFDVRQHGYKIQFVARGGSSVVTIPASDLDARDSGAEPGVQITTVREMDSQLPRRVTVNYLDYDREYNRGTQYAERLNTPSINSIQLDLPIVLTSTEGAGKAEVLLYLYWLERHDVSFKLPPTYNHLEPGDVVTLVTPEGNVVLRLVGINNTSAGLVECQAKYANPAIYTPTAIGVTPSVTGPTTITPVGASVYQLLDVPMISTAQAGPSFLAAMTGALSGWEGGVLMQSTDAGSTWASLQGFDSPGSTLGTCSNSIGVVDARVPDTASLLSVTLVQGDLYSVAQLSLFGGQNHFAYGADGRWEIIAAKTCTLVSGKSYTLANLLRGRFGTEWAMGLHSNGDSLVLLDTTDVSLIVMGSGTIGRPFLYRGITVDQDIGTDTNRSFTYLGVNLKPLSPIALTGTRDPSSSDWSLTWLRRTREGGEWRDYVDVPLGEASESYQIDVFTDGTYTTVKRTIATATQDASYSSVDQVADFGSNQATLYLKIYQISATVGRGYPLTQSITRP